MPLLRRTFVLEQRSGFNHTRPLLLMTDLIRSDMRSPLFKRIARLGIGAAG